MTEFKELGKIESAFFGFSDHHILTFMIGFKFGGTGQGFGNYTLDTYDKEKRRRVGTAAGTDLLIKILELFQVDEFSKLKGRYAYAIREKDRWGMIVGIELPEADGGKRFMISDWQQEWFPKEAA